MEIIGNGFLARHLAPLSTEHSGTTVLAAGVPTHPLPDTEHQRETRLVDDTIQHCLRRDRMLVFFSTVSMYGGPGGPGDESGPPVASTRYGQHKLDLERMIKASGARHLILRLGYVLGPDEPGFRLLAALLTQVLAGRVRVQRGARRDMLHVSDFVTVVDALLRTGVCDETVNVASGDCVEVTTIVRHLEHRLGVSAQWQVTDNSIEHCPSVRKLRRLIPEVDRLGFGPGYHRTAIDRYLAAARTVDAVRTEGTGNP
ncbi:NAD-dependent epimerase/dehydratase family protein [Streptomyces sp. BB1-1-1]|uniref:NAD-dependent epimerase/dehydratase family protein n=1 Tax=Streptomyces sp. BB1-1-1 TaxID=3074430 RepID=UPI002877BF48|nr:NAD-dependent epimerase/dehydratase family protein [Streptomyces sp. BB1-1-1]WND35040.1 NAD-dependent epimerase/dehydratase family protein [Streptomyces sp. BB1-1-1]